MDVDLSKKLPEIMVATNRKMAPQPVNSPYQMIIKTTRISLVVTVVRSKMMKLTVLPVVIVFALLNTVQSYVTDESRSQEGASGNSASNNDRSGLALANAQSSSMSSMASASASSGGLGPNYRGYPGQIINGVECYVCNDCPSVLLNTTTKICPPTVDSVKQRSCVVYVEKFKYMKRPWYIRGCASERGSCADITDSHNMHKDIVDLMSCDECIGDRCNTSGATRSLADVTIAFFVLVVTPLLGELTLS